MKPFKSGRRPVTKPRAENGQKLKVQRTEPSSALKQPQRGRSLSERNSGDGHMTV